VRRALPYLYLALNLACALLVSLAALHVDSVMRAEQRTAPDSVDGITFFTDSILPVLLALFVNVAWVAKGVVGALRRRTYRSFTWLGVAVSIWSVLTLATRLVISR